MATAQRQELVLPPKLISTQAKGLRLVTPLEEAVKELTISDAEEYQTADELLTNIRKARAAWSVELEGTPEKPGPLSLARQTKLALDALNRKIDGPMETLERAVRTKMQDYKREEQRQLREAQAKQDEEDARIQKELEEAAAREEAARTKPMQQKLAAKREKLEEQLEESRASRPVAVKAAGSTTRMVKQWKCDHSIKQLCAAVVAGKLPADVLTVDSSHVYDVTRMAGGWDMIQKWPGFTVTEDIIIAGRG